MKGTEIKKVVREDYAAVARGARSCCGSTCSCNEGELVQTVSKDIGYSDEELKSVPDGANMGLGCGNPIALASLVEGETVLDLGSGGGFDCFLASNKVGQTGKVIGVDMTPEMLEKARGNAEKGGYRNVEFRLGEIENLPAADNSVDAIISNCVINLSPDKKQVFGEAFRVLKPGGRLMISDIVLLKELPDFILNSVAAYSGCISGAMLKEAYLEMIKEAGFQNVKIVDENIFSLEYLANDPAIQAIVGELNLTGEVITDIASSIVSVKVNGVKPG